MKGGDPIPLDAELRIPGSLSAFARSAQLSFRETVTLLGLRKQIDTHRGKSISQEETSLDDTDPSEFSDGEV